MAAVVRDSSGNVLPFAQVDQPTLGSTILSGAPVVLNPTPVPANVGAATNVTTPTPTPVSTAQAPQTQPQQRRVGSPAPSSGVSTNVDDALIRAKADDQVRSANDQLSPTTLV